MATTATAPRPRTISALDRRMQRARESKHAKISAIFVGLVVVAGLAYIFTRLSRDLSGVHYSSLLPYILLGLALIIALGFEFVNGFHDTANAVATVIYTHSMEPVPAVVWSGVWNFLGVLTSSGTVAFSIVTLLPIELILKVSKGSGFSMVFALLTAAIIWNLATWWRGLPASSSHTMIGSIIGVGLMNQIIEGRTGTSGVDWEQVIKVGKALVFSPLIGFAIAGLLFLACKALLKDRRLYEAPEGDQPPPLHIRALLILTCTGVSFFHGSNDGQKGMGLIMLILVGTVPTAYALNHAIDTGSAQPFAVVSTQVAGAVGHYVEPAATVDDPAGELERFVSTHKYQPATMLGLQRMVLTIRNEATGYGSFENVPPSMQANVRNQMYLVSEACRLLPKYGPHMTDPEVRQINDYKGFLDRSTRFIPTWVKVAVALALGMGTMVGWKRIVVTVGEKIGKSHLTYAQGAAAEITAMITIGLADSYGLPVSTTHVLSSGVAGTMAANGSGLQMATIRNILMAWFFTLPAAAMLSAGLFWLFHALAR